MLARLDLRGTHRDLHRVLEPPSADESDDRDARATVRAIVNEVRARGDAALRELTERFDGRAPEQLRVPSADVGRALDGIPRDVRDALEFAGDQIRAYHRLQDVPEIRTVRSGIKAHEIVRPVDRAGLYAPGGRAPLASTVLMTAIPARVAGVPEVALCVPPGENGRVHEVMLAAAALAGVDEVYAVGGAQAIAALAYGTETIAAVDVVVGPGNKYVAIAKQEVAGVVGIESTAGPSELVVLADGSVPAEYVAIDLMAQAEHGPDGAAIVVSWDEAVLDAVDRELTRLVADAPRRSEIELTMTRGGRSVLVDDISHAIQVANAVAPEHLELMVASPERLVDGVRNAGAVFCGEWAPAVIGDYVAGTNHVLPTARSARFASALRVDDFRKYIHVVGLDRAALEKVAGHVTTLAHVEGLDAHAETITMRVGGA
jgi:histidinol dehydrogenase